MRKTILSITLLIAAVSIAFAQNASVQKAGKSVFTLTTFKEDGSIKATTHGVYFGEKGEGIAAFSPFIGASTATIIDATGKKADVTAIIGANEMYDICRFKLSTTNGTPLIAADTEANESLWSVDYSTKKPNVRSLNIASKERFLDKFTYYIFKEEINEDEDGCPIVNNAGQLIGLVQRSNSSYIIHTTDAKYYQKLQSTGFATHDRLLQKTGIRSALPDDLEQARLMLLMFDSRMDSTDVVNTVNEFNTKFPTDIDGLYTLARYNVAHNNKSVASDLMEKAVKRASDKAEAYARYSELVYNTALYAPDSITNWTLGRAKELIEEAININNIPAYHHHLGQVVFAGGNYVDAYSIFEEVSKSELAGSEVFYEMAQCKVQLNAGKEAVLELLDKSVEYCSKPLTKSSAAYIYARGSWLDSNGEYKKALIDYNLYDSLMSYNAQADFYHTRYACEMKVRQYQQALNDIAHAAYLNPYEVTYFAEMGSLNLRVGRYEDALNACNLSLNVTTEYADIHIIRGVALAQLGRKEEALEALNKAKELGDERAEPYIEKYCK